MEKPEYLEMTCEIAEEWLADLYEGYAYETDANGNVSYTDDAQEYFNLILADVQSIVAKYLRINNADGSEG